MEHHYLEGFKASPSVSNVKRMLVHEFGDSVFTVNNISIEAEFKMVRMRPHSKQNCVLLAVNCYRPHHVLSVCVDKISVFVFVVADEKLPIETDGISPSDFKQFIFVPSRTVTGQPNVGSDHVMVVGDMSLFFVVSGRLFPKVGWSAASKKRKLLRIHQGVCVGGKSEV